MTRNGAICRCAVLLTLVAALCCGTAVAQSSWSQQTVCRGWNNPTNFTDAGAGLYSGTYYEGRVGSKPSSGMAPNALQGQTGVTWSTSTINKSNMGSYTVSVGSSNAAIIPSNKHNNRPFEIYDSNDIVSGHPKNRDPNTGDGLRFVPTHYNTNDPMLDVQTNIYKSIRVGTTNGRNSGGDNCAALYYYIDVRPENALLYLYYACVFQDGSHGTTGDPAFMVRVMKETYEGSNVWVQASPTGHSASSTSGTQCDTLAYFITATSSSSGGSINLSDASSGWHGSFGYDNVLWKDWDKVIINLAPFLYSRVRLEVMVSGCYATVHYAYAYIAGECRSMRISNGACPAGESTEVATLTAPPGLRNYVWYRSEYGGVTPTNTADGFGLPNENPNSTAYYSFHQLTPNVGNSDTSNFYHVNASDFSVEYRPNDAHQQGIAASPDSLGNKQIFRCRVTSAINPNIEYTSDIYTVLQNTKPTMEVSKLELCGGDVQLVNDSYVTGAPSMVEADSTIWSFYDNPLCVGDPERVDTGASLSVNFSGSDMRYVKVRTNINELDENIPSTANLEHNACYSEHVYPIQPIPNPVGGFVADPQVLCDDNPTTLRDTTAVSTYRVFRFRGADEDSPVDVYFDSVVLVGADNRNYSRSFTHSVEPIEMTVRNGLYYLNPVNQSDTIWCENTLHDTVSVFLHPELRVTGDTVVCEGTLTDAYVSVVGADSCTYQWSMNYGSVTGNIPSGDHLAVTPYADTATYFVKVTSWPQGCVAWDSIHTYLVRPKLKMIPADGQICPGDEVTLIGLKAHHYSWSASPNDPTLISQSTQDTVVVTPQVNTTYTLVGHGSNDCNATPQTADVTVHPYPEPQVTLEPGIVDSEDPTVMLRDDSPYSVRSMWTFAGAEMVEGREVTHTFEEATGVDSVYVTLTNWNDIGCQTDYPFSMPVNLYTAWFPNIFTPGSEDENATFRLYTINVYELFQINIYNRFGQLVFDSSDPAFSWDGTMSDGSYCPQGTYTYICRYRKPGAYTVNCIYGSITLVR